MDEDKLVTTNIWKADKDIIIQLAKIEAKEIGASSINIPDMVKRIVSREVQRRG